MIETGPIISIPAARESPAVGVAPRARAPLSVKSEALLGERGELKIEHNGELYSLRRTRQGKLILTK